MIAAVLANALVMGLMVFVPAGVVIVYLAALAIVVLTGPFRWGARCSWCCWCP